MKRRPHIEVYAVKLTLWDGNLECERRLVTGYRAKCDCGWKTDQQDEWRDARDLARAHAKAHAAGAVIAAPVKP